MCPSGRLDPPYRAAVPCRPDGWNRLAGWHPIAPRSRWRPSRPDTARTDGGGEEASDMPRRTDHHPPGRAEQRRPQEPRGDSPLGLPNQIGQGVLDALPCSFGHDVEAEGNGAPGLCLDDVVLPPGPGGGSHFISQLTVLRAERRIAEQIGSFGGQAGAPGEEGIGQECGVRLGLPRPVGRCIRVEPIPELQGGGKQPVGARRPASESTQRLMLSN